MKNYSLILLPMLIVMFQTTKAQTIETNSLPLNLIEEIAESIAEELEEASDFSSILDDLQYFSENAINLNIASRNDLERLHILNSFQIENLMRYRERVGQMYTLFELQAIEGFDPETIKRLGYFANLLPPDVAKDTRIRNEFNFRFIEGIENQAGYKENDEGEKAYPGSRHKLYTRYKGSVGQWLQLGFVAEKDQGEDFFKGSNKHGFDYYSGFAGYQGQHCLKEIYIGDYQIKTGQGLMQWTGYGIGKSVEATSIRRMGQGIRGYTSTDENRFFRGTAVNIGFGRFNVLAYASTKKVDANVIEIDTDNKLVAVSSLQTSGYHRTQSENDDENSLRISDVGATLKFALNSFSVGLNGATRKLKANLIPSESLYNQFRFSGNQNSNVSADFLWLTGHTSVFGELAFSASKGKAVIAGIETQPTSVLALSFLFRDIDKDYHSIGGNTFTEFSGVSDERGIYGGIKVLPIPKVKVTAYADAYQSEWMRFDTNGPVRGFDNLIQIDYSPLLKLNMYLRFKSEQSAEKSTIVSPIKNDVDVSLQKLRLNADYRLNANFSCKFRGEYVQASKQDSVENGYLVFTDLKFETENRNVSVLGRVAYFDTDSYRSRVYTYESDLPYTFYIPAYYYCGLRYYLHIKLKLGRNLTFYSKLSRTHYLDDNVTIGTGKDAIEGINKTDIKLHLKWRF